jgi:hypothetical protein
METKRQELTRILEGIPAPYQRTFKLVYGRNGGKRPVAEAELMTVAEVTKEIPYKQLDWALSQVYNTVINILKE